MQIEKATSDDNEVLTEITKKSKTYWGYSYEQMELWSEVLTITKTYLETQQVYKLMVDNTIVGYYAFFYEDQHTIRLDNLFILPAHIGKGLGQMLMDHFLNKVKQAGITKVTLHSEPKAEEFYAKCGFITTGQKETSVKDRYLPIMELNISTHL
jgi:N-acetylglutamate synthase-like GNAT family acetyltransferase